MLAELLEEFIEIALFRCHVSRIASGSVMLPTLS
jgi:hypothetical protein